MSGVTLNMPYLQDIRGEKIGNVKIDGVNIITENGSMKYDIPLARFLSFFCDTMRSGDKSKSDFSTLITAGVLKGLSIVLDFSPVYGEKKKGVLLYYNRALTINENDLYDDMCKRLPTLGRCVIDKFKYFSFNIFIFQEHCDCDKFEDEWMEVCKKDNACMEKCNIKCKEPPAKDFTTIETIPDYDDVEQEFGENMV